MSWFSKKLKVQPPYDTLNVVQQRALYFLMEYFSKYARLDLYPLYPPSLCASDYLEKARWYFGLKKKDADMLRPYHQDINYLYDVIKDIKDKQILDYMVNNTYCLKILAEGKFYEPSNIAFYSFWNKFGYSEEDVDKIQKRYFSRTDI